MRKTSQYATAALVMSMLTSAGLEAQAEGPVTPARLTNPESENWLTTLGNYAGWRFSRLKEINRQNVAGMKLAFATPLGVRPDLAGDNQVTPLVDDGFLYVVDPATVV